ncbi:MAG: hypothetical protein NTX32_06570 [Candidatus Firestonebacteria bacterium]|nr:hypothetical protein [Candidatus Firestonebacteria bacterium]
MRKTAENRKSVCVFSDLYKKKFPKPPVSGLPKESVWYDASTLTIAGKGWSLESRTYERLPSRAEKLIPEKPWRQSLAGAGVSIRFCSNAPMFFARWVDYNNEWAKNQEPANQPVLYVREDGRWRWLGTSSGKNTPIFKLINDLIPVKEREYLLYLPMGRGVRKMDIGIPKGFYIYPSLLSGERPVLFYGTSIIHGASAASRPGLNLVALLERHFDYPFLNLGFSGSACMEPEVIKFVSEIDACVYIIDCLPNMVAKTVKERFVPAIRLLRKRRPQTPIIVVESLLYEDGFLVACRKNRCEGSNAELKKWYTRLKKEGVKGLSYVTGKALFGGETEVTRDGTHPTDFGYRCMAKTFIPLLAPYIKKNLL